MTDRPDFRMTTYIKCSQDALWEALTDPDQLIQYSFVASSCVREGNTLLYKMDVGAPEEMLMLICTYTEETPKTRIESTFEPHWDGPDVPLGASRFVYLIEPQLDFCKLTLEHYDLPADMTEGVADGWSREIAALKSFLETGQPVQFPDPTMMEG
jgi:uncharacterized protein YndB with AHSA1/START domain